MNTPPPIALGWRLRVLAATLGAVGAGLAAWYAAAGSAFVAQAVRTNRRAILRTLLTGAGPFAPGDYVAAADTLVVFTVTVLWLLAAVIAAAPLAERLTGRACSWFWSRTDHRRTAAARLMVVVAATSAVVLIAVAVLQRFPNSGDESCYLYQAETFARGRVTNAAHPLQEWFGFYHVRQIGDRLFSVFPPGWPAVLALTGAVGLPAWLINPALGALLLVLTFLLARRQHDDRTALAAMTLVAVSPFFLFNAASYFAHTFCAVLIVASAYCGERALDDEHLGWAAGAASALGVAALTRNYTAVWCAVPLAWTLTRRGRFGWRALMTCAAVGAPFVAASLWYNAATMGDLFSPAMGGGFEAYDNRWFPQGWVGRGIEITGGHLVRFVAWTPPALLGVYVWALVWRRRAWSFTDFIFPALVVGYFLYVDRGGNQYGPRYYHEAFPFVAIAVAAALCRPRGAEWMPADRWASYLTVVSVLACVPLLAYHAAKESRVIEERREPFRLVESGAVHNAVVIIRTGSGWTRPMAAMDLTRNDPDFTNDVLYAHDPGADLPRLRRYYSERAFWTYTYDASARLGRLEPLPPPEVPR